MYPLEARVWKRVVDTTSDPGRTEESWPVPVDRGGGEDLIWRCALYSVSGGLVTSSVGEVLASGMRMQGRVLPRDLLVFDEGDFVEVVGPPTMAGLTLRVRRADPVFAGGVVHHVRLVVDLEERVLVET